MSGGWAGWVDLFMDLYKGSMIFVVVVLYLTGMIWLALVVMGLGGFIGRKY